MKNIIIFPTDTVYGIGTHFLNNEGVKQINSYKGSDSNKPLAILCSNINDIKKYAKITKDAKILANHFMPGPLTIILKSKRKYYKLTNEKTIAFRIPNHQLALSLIKEYGPLKTTSVNLNHEKPINDYDELVLKYKDKVFMIYKNEEPLSDVSSTIIDLSIKPFKIIREGSLKKNQLTEILNKS